MAHREKTTVNAQEILRRYAAGECDFRYANLQGMNFEGQTLRGVDFRSANLSEANFHNADLQGTNFKGHVFSQADFRGADFRGANLRRANLGQGVETADFRGANFSDATLRGASLQGQNLTSTSFCGADIRGTCFNHALLRGANFDHAIAGVEKRWIVFQYVLTVVIATVVCIMQAVAGAFPAFFSDAANFNGSSLERHTGLGIYLLLIAVTYIPILLRGFSIQAFGLILIAFTIVFAFALVYTGATTIEYSVEEAFSYISTVTFAFAGAVVYAVAVVFAGIVSLALAISVSFWFSIIVAVTGAVTFIVVGVHVYAYTLSVPVSIESILVSDTVAIVDAIAIGCFSLNFLVSCFLEVVDEKSDLLKSFGIVLSTLGSTSFCGADLTNATFARSNLRNANFADSSNRSTTLTRVYWQGSSGLNTARLGRSILRDRRVRTILTMPEKGYKQDLTDANLRGANLKGVTLESAILRRATLNDALLEKAVLKDAILTEVQAIRADFTGVCLTGAILEAWNIDGSILEDIDCQYVFLREYPDEKGSRDRHPHNPDKFYQPGDFEKRFKEIPDEVKILIRNGVDPNALRSALKTTIDKNPDITQDAIKSFERQGKDVVMTLKVPEKSDKGKIERDWDDGYQSGLQAGKEEALIENAQEMKALAMLLAQKPITIHNESRNKVVTGSDQSQNIEVKGDFSVVANQSVVSLRDISGQVNNQVAALGDESSQAQLKDLLTQLQTAIEAEPELSEEDKTEALEEIKEIATAGQALQDGQMKKVAKRAIMVLKGVTVGLGETTKFVEACNGLLPAIAHLFGF